MEEYEAILNYLYESSRIPVWIFENEKIVFTDFSKETLRKEEELKTVFEYFLKNATGGADHPYRGGSGNVRFFPIFGRRRAEAMLCFGPRILFSSRPDHREKKLDQRIHLRKGTDKGKAGGYSDC